jgi:hypothetical protein
MLCVNMAGDFRLHHHPVPYCRLLFSNAASRLYRFDTQGFLRAVLIAINMLISARSFVLSQHSTFVKTHIVMLANVDYLNAVVADDMMLYGCWCMVAFMLLFGIQDGGNKSSVN